MKARGVPINDMYRHVLGLIDMDRPASHGADPFHFDKKPLYPPIVRSILSELEATVTEAAIAEHSVLDAYDAYYYARDAELPLPVLRVKFDDPAETWAYFDLNTSSHMGSNHRLSRLERWLFNGLHSLDFSFWYGRRPLWDIVLIGLSLGALATSAIGMYLGFRRLAGRADKRPGPAVTNGGTGQGIQ